MSPNSFKPVPFLSFIDKSFKRVLTSIQNYLRNINIKEISSRQFFGDAFGSWDGVRFISFQNNSSNTLVQEISNIMKCTFVNPIVTKFVEVISKQNFIRSFSKIHYYYVIFVIMSPRFRVGDLLYVFPCVILFLCSSVVLVLRLHSLGNRELLLVHFVRLFGLCLIGFVGFLFLLGSGKGCSLRLWHSLDFSLTFYGDISFSRLSVCLSHSCPLYNLKTV